MTGAETSLWLVQTLAVFVRSNVFFVERNSTLGLPLMQVTVSQVCGKNDSRMVECFRGVWVSLWANQQHG